MFSQITTKEVFSKDALFKNKQTHTHIHFIHTLCNIEEVSIIHTNEYILFFMTIIDLVNFLEADGDYGNLKLHSLYKIPSSMWAVFSLYDFWTLFLIHAQIFLLFFLWGMPVQRFMPACPETTAISSKQFSSYKNKVNYESCFSL